jgi:endoglucanase
MAELAERDDIAHQFEVLPLGGTDGGAIQRSRDGVPSVTLSTPSRYVHTVTEMVAKADLEAAVALLSAFLHDERAAHAPTG